MITKVGNITFTTQKTEATRKLGSAGVNDRRNYHDLHTTNLLRMVRVRKNLEMQAEKLIKDFEDKLKAQEARAKKVK
jgi:rubrerythrin